MAKNPGSGKTFEVSLVTPDGSAYEGEAQMLIVPGQIGEIGVLARHAPLIATLRAGSTRIHPGGDADVIEFAIGPGFFQVIHDRAIALVDDAVAPPTSTTRARGGSWRRLRPSSRRSTAASRRPTAGRSSSASATPRTNSRSPGANDARGRAPSRWCCSCRHGRGVGDREAAEEAVHGRGHGGREGRRVGARRHARRLEGLEGRRRWRQRHVRDLRSRPVRPDHDRPRRVGFETADGLGNVASIVGVLKSPGQAQTSWNRLVKPQLVGCVAGIVESLAKNGTAVKVISKGKHRLSVPGKRHAAYRIVANATSGGQQAKVYLDVILQGGGAANTVLIVTSVLSLPPLRSRRASPARSPAACRSSQPPGEPVPHGLTAFRQRRSGP